MRPISVALAIGNASLREDLRSEMLRYAVRVVLDQPHIETLQLMRLDLDLVVIDTEPDGETLEQIIRRIHQVSPRSAVAVASRRPDTQLVVDCMHAGANEFILPPFEDSVRVVVERATALAISRDAMGRAPGKVIGFVSAKGGCGATSIATHVAAAIERTAGSDVLLADLDMETGLIDFIMRPNSSFSLPDAVQNIHRLDSAFWKRNIANVRPHLDVLPSPLTTIRIEQSARDNYRRVLNLMRSIYGWVVADLGRGISPVAVTLLEDLDELYLVTTPQVGAMYQARQLIQRVVERGYPRVRLHVIVNRVPKKGFMPNVQECVGAPVWAEVSDDPGLDKAYSEGTLLAPDSALGTQFEALAARISEVPVVEKAKKGWTFLGWGKPASERV